jgi:4'-phosphopantetheinyl transferase
VDRVDSPSTMHIQSGAADILVACRPTDGTPDASVREAVGLLSAAERSRFDRFSRDVDRLGYALAHALLRNTLARLIGSEPRALTFEADVYGKPRLSATAEVSFSLSHTNGLVACAVARGRELGIDAEAIDRQIDVQGVANRYFSDTETAYVARGVGEKGLERFFEVWTLKEAFLKATGRGLSQSLDSISFDLEEHETIRYSLLELPPGLQPRGRGPERTALRPDNTDAGWQFAIFRPTTRHLLAVGTPWLGSPATIAVSVDERAVSDLAAERMTSHRSIAAGPSAPRTRP